MKTTTPKVYLPCHNTLRQKKYFFPPVKSSKIITHCCNPKDNLEKASKNHLLQTPRIFPKALPALPAASAWLGLGSFLGVLSFSNAITTSCVAMLSNILGVPPCCVVATLSASINQLLPAMPPAILSLWISWGYRTQNMSTKPGLPPKQLSEPPKDRPKPSVEP